MQIPRPTGNGMPECLGSEEHVVVQSCCKLHLTAKQGRSHVVSVRKFPDTLRSDMLCQSMV